MSPRTDGTGGDKPERPTRGSNERTPSGKDRPSINESSKDTVAANEKKFGGKAAEQPAKGSTGYTDKQLKATPKENTRSSWQSERGKHTAAAEKADRQGLRDAKSTYAKNAEKTNAAKKEMTPPPGRAAKSENIASNASGKKVEQHHHAGVSESRKAGLNPKVAGEKGRMTPLASSRSEKVHGTIDGKKYTHHNVASKIDKIEQARTAKAMGAPGETPRLPKGDAGRRGLVDSSGTSKWRLPDTVNQAERAKQDWTRKEPVGPRVDKEGSVIPDKAKSPASTPESTRGPAPKTEAAPAGKGGAAGTRPAGDAATAPKVDVTAPKAPKGEAPRLPKAETPSIPKVEAPRAPKGEAPRLPKAETPSIPKVEAPKAPKGEAPHLPRGGGGGIIGSLSGLAGVAGEAFGIFQDAKRIAAHDYPEKLPEGRKVELSRPDDKVPGMRWPTGYTVEKSNGEVIYRDRHDNQVTKEEAMRASSAPGKDQPQA